MQEDMVSIYEAQTLAEAKLFSDRLTAEGIANHLDNVDSPLDGLTLAEQTIRVMVLPEHERRARSILKHFLAEIRP